MAKKRNHWDIDRFLVLGLLTGCLFLGQVPWLSLLPDTLRKDNLALVEASCQQTEQGSRMFHNAVKE